MTRDLSATCVYKDIV